MLRYYVFNKVIQKFRDNFRVLKKKKTARQMGKFLSFVIALHWKRRLTWFAPKGDMSIIYQRRMRRLLTYHTVAGYDALVHKSAKIIFPFLLKLATISDLSSKGRRMSKQIEFLQTKMRLRMLTRFSKTEVLLNQWDKILG